MLIEHGPHDARVLRGDGDAGTVIAAAHAHSERPTGERIGLATRALQHAAGAHNEQRSEVRIAASGDVPESLLTAGGVLPRDEPEPRCELAAILELAYIAHARHDRRGGQRPDTLALLSELRGIVIVSGTIHGNVAALRKVVLHKSAQVDGDVETPSLVMEEGAVLNGKLNMSAATPKKPRELKAVDGGALLDKPLLK